MRAREAAVDRDRLSVDVRRVVGGQEERSAERSLLGAARALERIQLSDFVTGRPRSRAASNIGCVIPVSVSPGQIAFTRTPVPLS